MEVLPTKLTCCNDLAQVIGHAVVVSIKLVPYWGLHIQKNKGIKVLLHLRPILVLDEDELLMFCDRIEWDTDEIIKGSFKFVLVSIVGSFVVLCQAVIGR